MAQSVRSLASSCLGKSGRLSVKEDILGVYAADNPQDRSLKQRLDLIENNPFVRVALVIIQGATPSVQRDLDNANLVYQGECGSWVYCVDLITVTQNNLLVLDQDDCLGSGHSVSDEEDDLFDIGRSLGADVVGYYINSSNGGFCGCAAHPAGRRGFWVGSCASPWTFAHELGHVVGDLSHGSASGSSDNLMFTPTASITNPPPDLVNSQCNDVTNDPDMETC